MLHRFSFLYDVLKSDNLASCNMIAYTSDYEP